MQKLEWLEQFCLVLDQTSMDIKWGHDLCFLVNEKIFCVTGLDQESGITFKAGDEFEALRELEGCEPAPYLGRYGWIFVDRFERFPLPEWERLLRNSYGLIKKDQKRKKLSKSSASR